jgi:dihydrofolate reductase
MTQRRIVMFNQVSADGFFADPQGGLDWVVPDPELQRRAVASMPSTDCILLGRRTYDAFAGFWPHALRDSSTPGPHGESKHDPTFVAMARWLNDTQKLVLSRSLARPSWGPAEVLRQIDPAEITARKRASGKDILIFGSGSVVSQLSEHGLIDEYRFVVCPLLLGRGRPLLGELDQRVPLKLDSADSLPSGNVLLTYFRSA